ncbi:hypothetical protein [Pectinatus brassicae]|nr:hypothetical protein [Pectinatus brassicae]
MKNVKLPDIYKKEFINMNYKTPINTSNLLPLIAYEAVKQK